MIPIVITTRQFFFTEAFGIRTDSTEEENMLLGYMTKSIMNQTPKTPNNGFQYFFNIRLYGTFLLIAFFFEHFSVVHSPSKVKNDSWKDGTKAKA